MRSHIQIKHGEPKKINCEFCQYSSVSKFNLERHIKSKHNKEHDFPCNYCSKVYTSQDILRRHIVKHHGKRKATEDISNPPKKSLHNDGTSTHHNNEQPMSVNEINRPSVIIENPLNRPSVIVENPLNRGIEPEKEKNPPHQNLNEERIPAPSNEGLYQNPQPGPSNQQFEDYHDPEPKNRQIVDKNPDHVIEDTSSFKKTIFERRYKIRCGRDLLKCLYKYKAKYFRSIIKYFKRLHGGLNFYLDVQTDLQKADKDGNVQSASPYFSSGTRRLTDMSQYDELFEKAIVKIIDAFEKWVSEGSGWTMKRINSITLKIAKYSPIKGKSYIKTPEKLQQSNH